MSKCLVVARHSLGYNEGHELSARSHGREESVDRMRKCTAYAGQDHCVGSSAQDLSLLCFSLVVICCGELVKNCFGAAGDVLVQVQRCLAD
jgi:hypothetical protein